MSYLVEQNIEHIKVAVAAPQANGQVERVNRVLTPMLGKITNPLNHSDWLRLLTQVEYAINNSVHSSTKHTPSRLFFGIDQRGPMVDHLSEYLDDFVGNLNTRDLDLIRSEAGVAIRKSQ